MDDSERVTRYGRAGLTFHVRDEGAGAAILLLHGFPQDAASYDRVVPALHAHGYRTLAPTMRGYSAAARARGRRRYSTAELSDDVLALADAAGLDRVHLVGHDWGAAAAWAVAGRHPDRVATLTALSTPHPAAFTASLIKGGQLRRSWYFLFFQLPWVPEAVIGGRVAEGLRSAGVPEAEATRYAAALAEPGALTAALNWYRGVPFSVRTPVPPVTVPTSYVWGSRDFALGRFAAEHTADHVRADYRFVELDAGHWLPETRPQEVADAILDRVQPIG